MGKAQNQVVPYRDAALTRILQTALGGNSKTIMICALSPSYMNYEETLSTLRYADRAKKIKNVAVINESIQDRIIRELKEENKKLKALIGKIVEEQAKSGSSTINLDELGAGLGITDMKQALDEMNENENLLEDLEKPWEQKLQEKKEADAQKAQQALALAGTMEDSNLLEESNEESKDGISPLKEGKNNDDSLFSMATDAMQEARAKETEPQINDPAEERKSLETMNPMQRLARRKTAV